MRTIAVLLLALIVMTGCGHHENDETPIIAVSTGPQAWLAEELLPDSTASVIQLLPPGADPESYEPAVGTLKQLARSKVWLTMRTPGFEESLEPKIRANFPNLAITDVSIGIKRDLPHFCNHDHHDHGEHSNGNDAAETHEGSDPHLLSSIRNAGLMASNMSAEFQRLFPDKADAIKERETKLLSKLKNLDDSIAAALSDGHHSRAFLIEHPSIGYFARDYGLEQISLQEEGKESTPTQTAMALDHAQAEGAKVMFTEKEHPAATSAELARQSGIDIVEISLYSRDYLEALRKITGAL